MNVVAIIQARMGSTRLPGKVLAELAGRSMLARLCERVRASRSIDQLMVATTVDPDDRAIVRECDRLGVACFRGSRQDVLDRYHRAAMALAADVVVRVTADCPLIDPGVIDLVVESFLQQQPDYASNTLQRTWPRGLDTEVMTAAALARAACVAVEPYERTHVTPYIYQHPELFQLLSVTGREDHSRDRWTVDTADDLEFVRKIYQRLADPAAFGWRDVQRLVADEPALAKLNRHVRQKQLMEG